MRADAMTWVLRTVGAVFVVGALTLLALVVVQIRSSTGVPPLPVFVGILGLVALVLLSGACLALISLALSAQRGVVELRRIAAQGQGAALPAAARVFSPSPLQAVVAPKPEPEPEPAVTAPARPARPAGRNLVAER